ncbi:uncharacterized protein BP5553_06253 [Venustampulla echinocandica]|uniref:Uncharacterized protein n=1 Tax=Venustampulla echinocandica TaxID=2656787 RepID=A0A370TN07_9HELO|nr:uncharacterized protein BP5553_06253 [Venustampulla echinocandica]RDL36901.1 hypothetical protein BP5553_06253 [Venustampulla echinocandica]
MTAVAEDDCPLVNTASSLDTSMTLAGWPYGLVARRFYSGDELACWVPLLARLHRQGESISFGLVALDPSLLPNNQFDLDIGSYEGLERTLPFLYYNLQVRPSKRVRNVLRDIKKSMKTGDDFIPGLNDLVPLLSGMLATSRLRRIPAPNLYSRGVTASEGFLVFSKRLEDLVSTRGKLATKQSLDILSYVQDINAQLNSLREPERQSFPKYITEDEKFVPLILRCYEEMTNFLRSVNFDYNFLVWVHITQAVMPLKPLTDRHKAHELYGLDPEDLDERLVTSMESYFDALPDLPSRFTAYSYAGWSESFLPELEDSWLSMIFRAFCWQQSHEFIEGVPPLPSEYWNSKMPVYIG